MNFGFIICNNCGRFRMYIPRFSTYKHTPFFEMKLREAMLKSFRAGKSYFKKQGWDTSPGYDLCPSCKELK